MWSNFSLKFAAVSARRSVPSILLVSPQIHSLPIPMLHIDDPLYPLGKHVIDCTSDYVCGYIFDFAPYLKLGAAGAIALERTIRYVNRDLVTILHGPFMGDQYESIADITAFGVDAITVITHANSKGLKSVPSFAVADKFSPHYAACGGTYDVANGKLLWNYSSEIHVAYVSPGTIVTNHHESDFGERIREHLIQWQDTLAPDILHEPATTPLIIALFKAGLIQFGLFNAHGDQAPYRFRFDLLPAYPRLLRGVAETLTTMMRHIKTDRIVAVPDTIALGTVVSQITDIPLVYTNKPGVSSPSDLTGAYDIGHPAILLLNSTTTEPDLMKTISVLKRFGLEIHTIFVLEDARKPITAAEITVTSLFDLAEMTTILRNTNLIPQFQATSVEHYLSSLGG